MAMLIKKIYYILQQTVVTFIDNNVLRMCAALSFYTFFAIGPMLLIVTYGIGLFYNTTQLQASLFAQISSIAGEQVALQIKEILLNNNHNISFANIKSVVSILALVFSATGVFTEIQSSINTIWQLKAKPKNGFLKYLFNRVISLSVILSLGFVLLVSLLLSTAIDVVFNYFHHHHGHNHILFNSVIQNAITMLVITFVFGTIFKFLPDAKVQWKDILASAIISALLFMIGKFFIGYYITATNPTGVYGAATSAVIIFLWVYYSSIILYIGACFTKVYAKVKGRFIYPNDYAVYIEQIEVQHNQSLNQLQTKPIKIDKENLANVVTQ